MSGRQREPDDGLADCDKLRSLQAPATNVVSYRHANEKAASHGAAFSHLGIRADLHAASARAHPQGLVHSALEFPPPVLRLRCQGYAHREGVCTSEKSAWGYHRS